MPDNHVAAYDPREIEPKWQRAWAHADFDRSDVDAGKAKYYLLEMLPYPSGDLHVGHARNYTLGDVIGRYMRMRGFNLMHPMGWDAFGLPAENAAIERGIHPREWTQANIDNMRRQIQSLGTSYDWSREIDTSSPEFYRWTQWLFLFFWRQGLAYKKEAPVNWCPHDKTVLANEQVIDGRCWRCEHLVERRMLAQWFLKITEFADDLLAGLERLAGWPERVKTMQFNWIGRSEGVTFGFEIEGPAKAEPTTDPTSPTMLEVFTTRLDTVYGATFIAIAPEHPLLERLIAGKPEEQRVRAFVAALKDKAELDRSLLDKDGVFTGAHALHPFTRERVPIWVTNYVVVTYGTGAVGGVPAHDERDLDFAKRFGLPVTSVIAPAHAGAATPDAPFVEDGVLVNSGPYSGLTSAQARAKIAADLAQRGLARKTVNYKLRDWLISRQRYWGAPIPFVNCPNDGLVPVPEEQLPVRLPDRAPLSDAQGSPLASVPEFVQTVCPACGGPATRETDTMDTFMCSSWYYLRYLSPREAAAPWSQEAARYWAPIDQYIGGIEHAILHLMYARFTYKALNKAGLVPGDEPFVRLFNQGMILGENHEKMSKSRHNTIAIDHAVRTYGADALRIFEMFAGPPDADFPWSTTGIAGATRMLTRVWRLVLGHAGALRAGKADAGLDDAALRFAVHSRIKQVTDELGDRMHLNTSVAAIMSLLNDLEEFNARANAGDSAVFVEGLRALLLLLAPFAPHITEELWERSGAKGSIHAQPWPRYDPAALRRALVPVVIQVNGKRRGVVEAPPGASEDDVFGKAAQVDTVRHQLDGKTVRKRVFVPDRLLNIVAN